MKDFRIDIKQIELLNELIGIESTIIWDINAFYFNSSNTSYKLECLEDIPAGSEYKYDEIFYCEFIKHENQIEFEEGNPKYWYKIIDKKAKIESIEIINIIQEFPDDELLNNENETTNSKGINRLTIGLIIKTENGWIPAFLLPSNHGFSWQGKYQYYQKEEVEFLLRKEIKKYQIKTVLNKR